MAVVETRKMITATLREPGPVRRWVRRTWAPGQLRRDVRLWAIWSSAGGSVVTVGLALVLIGWPGPPNPGTPFNPPTDAPTITTATAPTADDPPPVAQIVPGRPSRVAPRVTLRAPLSAPQSPGGGLGTLEPPTTTQAISAPPDPTSASPTTPDQPPATSVTSTTRPVTPTR